MAEQRLQREPRLIESGEWRKSAYSMLDKLISGGQAGVDWAALGRPIGGGYPIDRSVPRKG